MDDSNKAAAEAETDERRSSGAPSRSERRVTARLNEPTLRVVFSQYIMLCKIWIGFAALFVLGEVASNFILAESRWARTLFYCVVVATLTYAIRRLQNSVTSYLTSESVGKSIRVFQDALALLFVFVVIMILFAIVHLLNVY